MRKIGKIIMLCGLILVLVVGCENKGNTGNAGRISGSKSKSVDDVLNQQVSSADSSTNIDYDLTIMGSDMIYATVYQMMVNPDEYTGKTFRMNGLYSAYFDESTKQYYHYCIIEDATACCAQGLEFVWDDGSHVYPDDYPEENVEIVITGIFETYQDENDSNLYCHLNNATLEVGEGGD